MPELMLSKFNILLIDDDEDDFVNLRGLFQEIRGSKYAITWKSNYEEGLKALQDSKFDICLLDYRLGAKTGLELLHEAQSLGLRVPAIFLTGQGDFDLDLQAMQIGASDYLVKNGLTAPLLERSVRYSIKHEMDMDELRESKAQILQQDRLASLGLLASSLAHEIGTPLGIIRSRAELAAKKAKSLPAVLHDMNTIITQIDRIAKLVNSLLQLARGQKSENAHAINLNSVVEDMKTLLSHELELKEIAFICSIEPSTTVKAESGPLSQVFLNLLVNAVHAIDEKRKKVLTGEHKIEISATEVNNLVKIKVSDTGCGIPEIHFSQIFKPFFTTKEIGQGTGLGLATTFKLIASWGGAITVKSVVGHGTCFEITLPNK